MKSLRANLVRPCRRCRAAPTVGQSIFCSYCKRLQKQESNRRTAIDRKLGVKRNRANVNQERIRVAAWVCQHLQRNPCAACGQGHVILLEFVPRPDVAIAAEGGVETLIRRGAPLAAVQAAVAACDVLCVACVNVQTAYLRGGRLAYRVPYAGAPPDLSRSWYGERGDPTEEPAAPAVRRRFEAPAIDEAARERLRIAERDRRLAARAGRAEGQRGVVPPTVPQPHELGGEGVVEPEVARTRATDFPPDSVGRDEPTPKQPTGDAAQEDVGDDPAGVRSREPVGEAASGRGEDDPVDAGQEGRLGAEHVHHGVVGGRRIIRRLPERGA